MIGGMRIMPWRQCNAVAPAVTATQTGAGAHNGMALTVKVLTGANIASTGPGSYDYAPVPGAAGAADATAPASVTITPLGTGSWLAGAVNRNDTAAAWTPAASTVFSQNVADATNGATYGTFRGGAAAAPTLTASYPVYIDVVSGTSLVTGSFTPAAGEILVCKIAAASHTTTWPSGLPSGGGLIWTQQVINTSVDLYGAMAIWTSSPVGASPSPMTVTLAYPSGSEPRSMVVERWSGAVIATVPSINSAWSASGHPNSSLTAQALSQITWCSVDWAPVDGATRAYNTTSATPAEDGYRYIPPVYTGYYASQAIASPGVQTFGLTAPAGQTWTIGGMEILAGASSSTTTAGVPATAGASNGPASGYGGVAVAEILTSGTLAEDPSSPAPVNTTSATTVTTARFTPPMGSLLVAEIATAGTAVAVTVTDDNGALDWYELASWHSGTSGYAGIWAAVVVCG